MGAHMQNDTDQFWSERIGRLGSNSAADGYDAIRALILSGKLSSRDLRALASALRALSGKACDEAARTEELAKFPHLRREA